MERSCPLFNLHSERLGLFLELFSIVIIERFLFSMRNDTVLQKIIRSEIMQSYNKMNMYFNIIRFSHSIIYIFQV